MKAASKLEKVSVAAAPGSQLRDRLLAFLANILPTLAFFLVLVLAWEILVVVYQISPIILPRPSQIFVHLYQEFGYFWENGLVTFYEAVSGFFLGALVAFVLAIAMARSRLIERCLFPAAVLVKATPIVVIAPLLIVWMGYGPAPKIVMAALICFFPILVNSIIGLRSVGPTQLEFFKSIAASEREIFLRLRLPHSMPYVLSALKTSVSLSVIGAVVAEWAGATQGLGRVVFLKAANLDQVAVFAGVFVLAAMGILLTAAVSWVEKTVLHWHESMLTN